MRSFIFKGLTSFHLGHVNLQMSFIHVHESHMVVLQTFDTEKLIDLRPSRDIKYLGCQPVRFCNGYHNILHRYHSVTTLVDSKSRRRRNLLHTHPNPLETSRKSISNHSLLRCRYDIGRAFSCSDITARRKWHPNNCHLPASALSLFIAFFRTTDNTISRGSLPRRRTEETSSLFQFVGFVGLVGSPPPPCNIDSPHL